MNTVLRHNLRLLTEDILGEATDVERPRITNLADHLLRGFKDPQLFRPLRFRPEPTIPEQLQQLFDRAGGDIQTTLKSAVIQAIADWGYESHGLESLPQLAYTAAYMRASGSIMVLSDKLADLRELDSDDDSVFETTEIVVAVIAGFAPYKPVEIVCKRLFYDDAFDPRHAGQLLVAIARCSPATYSRHLGKFLSHVEALPTNYELYDVFAELIEAVGIPTLMDGLPDLTDRVCAQFVGVLEEAGLLMVDYDPVGKQFAWYDEMEKSHPFRYEGPTRNLMLPRLWAHARPRRRVTVPGKLTPVDVVIREASLALERRYLEKPGLTVVKPR